MVPPNFSSRAVAYAKDVIVTSAEDLREAQVAVTLFADT